MIHGLNKTIEGIIVQDLKQNIDSRGQLVEIFRSDKDTLPAMAYWSETKEFVIRGPHEHIYQTDVFIFLNTNFKLFLWDNRSNSKTYENKLELTPRYQKIIVPPGVVHAYMALDNPSSWCFNFPDKLYRGHGGKDKIDEIRHELDPNSKFKI